MAVAVRPESITLLTERAQITPAIAGAILEGTVEDVSFIGESLDCRVRVGTMQNAGRLDPTAAIREGQRVFLKLPPEACRIVPKRIAGLCPWFDGLI